MTPTQALPLPRTRTNTYQELRCDRVIILLTDEDPLVTDLTRSPADSSEMTGLAALLAPLGTVLLSTETITSAVELVTALLVETIPGTTGAGVTVVDSLGKRNVAASDDLVLEADRLQYELDEGPCLDSWRDRAHLQVDDTTIEARWPQWSRAAAQVGVRSMLSSPLLAGQDCVGAIKVYSTEPGAFDARAAHLLELFARQAAVLLANVQTLADARRTSRQLTEALQTRDVIGQAKGILLARGAADDQTAFATLLAISQHTNAKLRHVARDLVESVTTPTTDLQA
ncbi:GAF and ANTAR domain-containing protein [Microlunatus lacustris]